MAGEKFHITDVFCNGKYTGNQLATFMESADIPTNEMQVITQEMNYSETTFILSDKENNGGYDVRIFTPTQEVDFAGHPTLGTAFIIREYIIKEKVEQVILNLKVGQIPVTFDDSENTLWMKQIQPVFLNQAEPEAVAAALGLSADDLDSNWPVEEVSTGLPFLIIPLKNMDILKKCMVDIKAYNALIEDSTAKDLLVFAPGGYTKAQTLGVRVFPIYEGIMEDAATGSGNGCLAAYLVKHRYFGQDNIDIQVGQGYEIKRSSQLFLKANQKGETVDIFIGGRVMPIAKGHWQPGV